MAPQDKAHELALAKQRIQVLELSVQILERKLELAKMNQRSVPYTYPPSYPTISYTTSSGGQRSYPYTLETNDG